MFEKTSQSISKEEIEKIETELNILFPSAFVEHYLKFNGGIPTAPFFYSEESDIEIEIQIFSPIKYLHADIDVHTVEEKYVLFKRQSKLMAQYLPFANDFGANQICININNGKICIIYMDMGEVTEECVVPLVDDFEAFLTNLSEESIDED